MNYRETIDFLFNSLPMYQRTGKAAYKANLNNTIALDTALGHPHRQFKSVLVAGTNGKGSVSHMLASIFREAGYTTGLYTSPHLVDFRERIRVNGEMIGEEHVVRFVDRIKDEIDRIQPSFFEMTVAMAFDHFAREKVDIAIIETGMGGRLDSTNIINPVVSLITSIAMDHAEFLGDTEVLIAREKGGIIKKGTPVIIGKNCEEVCEVLTEMAGEKEAGILFADRIRDFLFQTFTVGQTSHFHFKNHESGESETIHSDLSGTYQSENINLVLTAIGLLREAGWDLPDDAVADGFAHVKRNTALRGRWEILGANPRIIADTAHNESGIRAVMAQLKQVPSKRLHIVWGMVGDKPVEAILQHLPKEAVYYFTQPAIPRAMPVENLVQRTGAAGLQGDAYPAVAEAFAAAKKAAGPDDTIYIGGSTFVVGDLLTSL
jgi:dihydrofolate synthase / folylpolyglutamate synthase